MAKHDGEQCVWIEMEAHMKLLRLSEITGKPMVGLASVAIEQYCRRRSRWAKRKAKAGKDH